MLAALGQISLIVACALGLCIYTGWGAAALGLPRQLQPFAAPLAPLVGYAIAIWLGYMGVSTAFDLRWSLALLLVAATGLNLAAWRRGARPGFARLLARRSSLTSQLGLAALFVATLMVGVLPLLHYGYLTAIGQGWDTETALPLAQHLLDYPVARIGDAPISPLRDLVRNPPALGKTIGFAVFQGMTMLLSGQGALATFAPLIALLRALGILAIYVWLRATMGPGRTVALFGAAGASAGGLLLWVGFFNFEKQMSAWPLLALSLALGLAALDDLAQRRLAAWPAVLLAGLAIAAICVAYYPALTIWVPMALGLGAARIVEAARRRGGEPGLGRLILSALVLGGLALLLSALPVRDYFEGFSFRYSLIAQHVGPDRFIAPAETIGLLAFRLPNDGPQPPAALVVAGTVLLAMLALAGLVLPATMSDERGTMNDLPESSLIVPRSSFSIRLRWLGVLLAVVAYLAWLRFGRPYEYAYMKGSAYAGFVAWGLAALGWQSLSAWFRRRWAARSRFLSSFLFVPALAPLLVAIWAQALTVADYWRGPAIFTRDIAAFDSAAAQIPRGAVVVVTSDAAFTGPLSGQLSTSLYGREIWGHLSTAYTTFDRWPTGRLPQYAVLSADERPWPLDYGGHEQWRSGTVALYRLGDETRVLQGRSAFYSSAPPTDRGSPAVLAIWRRGGAQREAGPDAPLTISVGDTLDFGSGTTSGTPGQRQVRLTVASLVSQTVTLGLGDRREQVAIIPGVSHIDLRMAAPGDLAIAPSDRLALIDAVANDSPGGPAPVAQADERQLAWSAAAEQRGSITSLRVELANPGRHALRIGLTVVEDTFDGPRQLLRLLAAAPIEGAWRLDADLARGATEARAGERPVPLLAPPETTPGPPDGLYFGMLTLYNGEEPIAQAPVFRLSIVEGAVAAFDPVPFTAEASPVGRIAEPLPSNEQILLPERQILDGGAVALDAALLRRRPPWPGAGRDAPLRPGDSPVIQLSWQATQESPPLMVSVQLLGGDDHKYAQWDGPIGGDWRPIQSWAVGERVRQDVPLALDPATPPGSYRLLLVVYDPATGQPRLFGGQSALGLGEVVVR
jgi:hypothetical protein